MTGILTDKKRASLRLRSLAGPDGATATEYVIVITLIAGVIIAVVFVIGGQLSGFFEVAANVF